MALTSPLISRYDSHAELSVPRNLHLRAYAEWSAYQVRPGAQSHQPWNRPYSQAPNPASRFHYVSTALSGRVTRLFRQHRRAYCQSWSAQNPGYLLPVAVERKTPVTKIAGNNPLFSVSIPCVAAKVRPGISRSCAWVTAVSPEHPLEAIGQLTGCTAKIAGLLIFRPP